MKIKSRVYIDLELRNNQTIIPSSEIQHYLIRVLRCNLNDFFSVFNGKEEWITKVSKLEKNYCELITLKLHKKLTDRCRVDLFISPLKKAPFEFVIQKCSELGVDEFHPVHMQHTNKGNLDYLRLEMIAKESAEQCGRITVPKIHKVKNFEECFKNSNYDFIIYCSLNEKDKHINGNIIKKETNRVAIVIGPEGDFSKSEFEQLENNDKFYPVSLGTTVLKSETAAIVATALLKNEINNA